MSTTPLVRNPRSRQRLRRSPRRSPRTGLPVCLPVCLPVLLLPFALAGAPPALAQPSATDPGPPATRTASQRTVRSVRGVAVTGLNQRLGEPLRDFGPPLGPFGFATAAAFNPTGGEPLPLTPSTPADTLLATTADPAVLAIFGVDPDEIDPSVLNIPLREVPVNVDPGGEVRIPLDGAFAVPPLTPHQAAPVDPITVGDWLRAEGEAQILCGDGAAVARLRMRNLIPNRLYTVWAAFATPAGPRPIPFGGVPNTFSTDERGSARFVRSLQYCPFEPTSDGGLLLSLIAVLHSDHQVYAVEPALPRAGLPPGVVAHAHLEFGLAGEPLP